MRNTGAALRRVRLTHRIVVFAMLGLLAAAIPVLSAPARAAVIGDDYPTGLKNAPQDSLVDPWKFYNRECTSFVAWRLVHTAGTAFDNYFLGAHWGNASHWADAARSVGVTVDNAPVPGAVAWWAAGTAGSSRGHVAWVASVGGSSIVVEEYNYLHEGYYDTRTIPAGSSIWPSGFIHVKDTALRNTVPPAITGTAQVGVKLTTSRGSWSPGKPSYDFQWLANGKPVAGATRRSFTPTAAQLGQKLRAVVTATEAGMQPTTVKTPATGAVAAGVFTASAPPTLSGTPQVGLSLSATTGTWTPAGSYAYRWFANHKRITGAAAATYRPTAKQLGKVINVKVLVSAPGYTSNQATSADSAPVAAGQFAASGPPTISGTPQVDQPLTVAGPTWTPTGRVTYQWLADGNPISGATGTTYTPTADDVYKQISVWVSVARTGYQTAIATSAPTDHVAAGAFVNSQPPTVSGNPQVGVVLTAVPGAWSPDPSFAYQWLVDGATVAGATASTYTPTAADLGKPVAVQVTATRPGYNATLASSAPTGAVVPGEFASSKPPAISGRAASGHTLTASSGTWSPTPEGLAYQWYDDDQPVAGATGTTYVVSDTDAGQRLTVQVTATSTAYQPKTVASAATRPAVLGRLAFAAAPRIAGRAILGHTLTARVGTSSPPTTTTPAYRWFRGKHRIHGAKAASYVVRKSDVGSRLHVRVKLRAPNWTPRTDHSKSTLVARSVPTLTPHWSLQGGRVLLRLGVRTPGLKNPRGLAPVYDGSHVIARVTITNGGGRNLLPRLPAGRHKLRIVYAGNGPQVAAHLKLIVRTP